MDRSAWAGFSLLLVIILLCGMADSSLAAATEDLDPDNQTGFISVTLEKDEGDTGIDGALTLYKVADLSLPE